MKKLLTIVISIILSLLLFGCGNENIHREDPQDKEDNPIEEIEEEQEENTDETGEETNPSEEEEDNMTQEIILEGIPQAIGIWHRPNVLGNETNLSGIENTLDTFKRCGINIVFLETVYHGMAMYKSSLLPYYNGFSSNTYGEYRDYLDAFTHEAEKRGIEVHAWVEDFYIGISEGTLVTNHQDWILLTKNGSKKQSEGNGYIFLDPANQEVTDFLTNVYHEMLNKNPLLKGINLDYIRYPVSSKSDDTGYTKAAMKGFLAYSGYQVTDETKLVETFNRVVSNNYPKWTEFRAKKVSDFVKQVRDMTNVYFDNIVLSTAVFPNMSQSYDTKKQDFSLWMKNKYIDVVTPMAYYDSTSTLDYYLREMVSENQDVYCYTGVSCIYHKLSSKLIKEQIDKCLSLSQGFVIFGSQMLLNSNEYIRLLEDTFKNETYYLPHLSRGNK